MITLFVYVMTYHATPTLKSQNPTACQYSVNGVAIILSYFCCSFSHSFEISHQIDGHNAFICMFSPEAMPLIKYMALIFSVLIDGQMCVTRPDLITITK